MASAKGVTQLLVDWSKGDETALQRLLPLVYEELRLQARRHLSGERPSHTLQPTALVHEVYLRLVDQRNLRWQNRAQFFALAAQLMRHILVDHARARATAKRGGGTTPVSLSGVQAPSQAQEVEVDVIALDEALARLAAMDAQQGRIVELRFFGGLTIPEIAEVVELSPATIKREWSLAKVWLYRAIHEEAP
jgi:RNA polymerase sigma factor (TIGR02999 family)